MKSANGREPSTFSGNRILNLIPPHRLASHRKMLRNANEPEEGLTTFMQPLTNSNFSRESAGTNREGNVQQPASKPPQLALPGHDFTVY